MLDKLRGIGELTIKGFVAANAPTIFKGVLNEVLHNPNVTVKKVISLVEENGSLWEIIPEDYHSKITRAAQHIDDLDWLTVDWMINAIKREHPALASLFLSWRKARNWLERQLTAIKEEIQS
jgi:hypothetical protein